jgi:hypothetical protein
LTESGRHADNLDTSSLRRANIGNGKRRFVDKPMPRGIVGVSHPRREMNGLLAEVRPAREWGQGEGCFTHGSLQGVHFRKAGGRNLDNLTVATAIFDANGNFVVGAQKNWK